MTHHGRRPSNPQTVKPRARNRRVPPPPPTREGRPTIDGCSMALPVAVALLPYALVRMALDGWRGR